MHNDAPARRTVMAATLAGLLLSSCATADATFQSVSAPPAVSPENSIPTAGQGIATSAPHVASLLPASAPGTPLSLEQAVHIALNWHPSIDEAVGRINQHTAEIDVARAGYYPKVSGGIDTAYRSGGGGSWQPRLNVSASQMVYDFGKVSNSVDASIAGANVSRAQLLVGVDVLIRDTANAVIEMQRYRALLGIAREQLGGVQNIADLVRQRSDRGASTRSDEIQASAREQAAQSTVLEINAQLQRWENTLANLIGRNGPINVASTVPQWLSSACDIAEPDWTQVPAVLQAEAQRAEALAELNLTSAQAFPTLQLEGNTGYDFNGHSASNDQPEFTIGFNLSGSLYDGGAAAAGQAAASHALDAADAAIRSARLDIGSSLLVARSQTSSLQQLLGSLMERDGMMRQTRDLYRQQYVELGTRTLLDLLNAEQELHQAGFDAANATHDLRLLGVECMFNSGRARHLLALDGMTVRGVELL